MSKFRISLILLAIVLWLFVWYMMSFIFLSTDSPTYYGSPALYKAAGCWWTSPCINEFYPAGLIIDIIYPIVLLICAYFIGKRFDGSSFIKKSLVFALFILGTFLIAAASFILGAFLSFPRY